MSPRKTAAKSITVRIASQDGAAYRVLVGANLLAAANAPLTKILSTARAALVLADDNLPAPMLDALAKRLDAAKLRSAVVSVSAGESEKSLATVERGLIAAAKLRLERSDLVIGLGGGIVTDVAGFVAAIHRRGCRSLLVPTTLLSMVDAAVGGKTGVNLAVPGENGSRLVKNAVGSFHQPSLVLCDASALASLPEREFRSGLAECIKHALLGGSCGDETLLDWTAEHLDAVLAHEPAALSSLIARNVALKARVVADDERELSTDRSGGRMRLNLGHTFAHAIETLPNLFYEEAASESIVQGPLKHGEAVALGLIAAASAGEALKLLPRGHAEDLRTLIAAARLPTRVAGLPASEKILERMWDDKKVAAGKLRLILPTRGRKIVVRDTVPAAVVLAAIEEIRA